MTTTKTPPLSPKSNNTYQDMSQGWPIWVGFSWHTVDLVVCIFRYSFTPVTFYYTLKCLFVLVHCFGCLSQRLQLCKCWISFPWFLYLLFSLHCFILLVFLISISFSWLPSFLSSAPSCVILLPCAPSNLLCSSLSFLNHTSSHIRSPPSTILWVLSSLLCILTVPPLKSSQ